MVNRRLKARRLDLKASVTESLDDDLGRVFGVKDLRREIATASRSKIGLTSAPRRTAAQDRTAGHNPASPENLIFLDRGCLGACPNSHCSILSESDSSLGHEQVFSPLEYRSDAASAAECAGLRAERPCLAVYR